MRTPSEKVAVKAVLLELDRSSKMARVKKDMVAKQEEFTFGLSKWFSFSRRVI